MVAFAVHRFRFFGREAISFLILLPLALPGIVTGIALNTTFRTFGVELGLFTVIVGHATFCVVVVYNNVVARLRRTGRSAQEASMDLGADTWTPSGWITLPAMGTALVAGALLAFALSLRRDHRHDVHGWRRARRRCRSGSSRTTRAPNQLPLVNVASVMVLVLSIIPVYIAARASPPIPPPSRARAS